MQKVRGAGGSNDSGASDDSNNPKETMLTEEEVVEGTIDENAAKTPANVNNYCTCEHK